MTMVATAATAATDVTRAVLRFSCWRLDYFEHGFMRYDLLVISVSHAQT